MTVAGNGTWGLANDGGPATLAQLQGPNSLTFDTAGNLYFTEFARVRKVSPNGIITTIAGSGIPGFNGDGGPAKYALLSSAYAIAIDPAGNVFFSDRSNHRIREVTRDGNIQTVAGNGVQGLTATGPTDGPALSVPVVVDDLAFDFNGALLFCGNGHVKRLSNGILSNVVDVPTGGLCGLTVDRQGNIYVSGNQQIRRISRDGVVALIAGTGGAGYSGMAARLSTRYFMGRLE